MKKVILGAIIFCTSISCNRNNSSNNAFICFDKIKEPSEAKNFSLEKKKAAISEMEKLSDILFFANDDHLTEKLGYLQDALAKCTEEKSRNPYIYLYKQDMLQNILVSNKKEMKEPDLYLIRQILNFEGENATESFKNFLVKLIKEDGILNQRERISWITYPNLATLFAYKDYICGGEYKDIPTANIYSIKNLGGLIQYVGDKDCIEYIKNMFFKQNIDLLVNNKDALEQFSEIIISEKTTAFENVEKHSQSTEKKSHDPLDDLFNYIICSKYKYFENVFLDSKNIDWQIKRKFISVLETYHIDMLRNFIQNNISTLTFTDSLKEYISELTVVLNRMHDKKPQGIMDIFSTILNSLDSLSKKSVVTFEDIVEIVKSNKNSAVMKDFAYRCSREFVRPQFKDISALIDFLKKLPLDDRRIAFSVLQCNKFFPEIDAKTLYELLFTVDLTDANFYDFIYDFIKNNGISEKILYYLALYAFEVGNINEESKIKLAMFAISHHQVPTQQMADFIFAANLKFDKNEKSKIELAMLAISHHQVPIQQMADFIFAVNLTFDGLSKLLSRLYENNYMADDESSKKLFKELFNSELNTIEDLNKFIKSFDKNRQPAAFELISKSKVFTKLFEKCSANCLGEFIIENFRQIGTHMLLESCKDQTTKDCFCDVAMYLWKSTDLDMESKIELISYFRYFKLITPDKLVDLIRDMDCDKFLKLSIINKLSSAFFDKITNPEKNLEKIFNIKLNTIY